MRELTKIVISRATGRRAPARVLSPSYRLQCSSFLWLIGFRV